MVVGKLWRPDALPFNPDDRIPAALDEAGINQVIEAFRTAAQRAVSAGFKIAEIHSAHGYLLHEFLSPLSNRRTDQYGGSFENRIRLLLQVVEVVRKEWPAEYPLFVRLSAADWTEGGWTPDETVKLAALLKDRQVDLIDCSSGGNVASVSIPLKPGYQVPFAASVKKTGILTGAVGLITSAQQAEGILQQRDADLILLGREMLRNPYFALEAAHELKSKTDWPAQYLRAKPVD